MAGEYSRELSAKVFKGQCRLIELGYRQGGAPGYGLRRTLVNAAGEHKGVLARGEQKSLQTDRVILVPGPPDEVEVVRWVYEQFNSKGKREAEIAEELNAKGLVTDLGRPWSRGTVREVLSNEKYVGHNVYNRTSFKLQKRHVSNPPEMWVRAEGAFAPLVDPADFFVARGVFQERARRLSDDDMLAQLARLGGQHPVLSARLIDQTEGMPSAGAYRARFGGLLRAYRLAGLEPPRDDAHVEVSRALRALRTGLVGDLVARLEAAGASVSRDEASGLLLINGEYSAGLVLSRFRLAAVHGPRFRDGAGAGEVGVVAAVRGLLEARPGLGRAVAGEAGRAAAREGVVVRARLGIGGRPALQRGDGPVRAGGIG
jgi:hypothetical protein